jgi:hypothetical protein
LLIEGNELLAIIVKSIKTAKENEERKMTDMRMMNKRMKWRNDG